MDTDWTNKRAILRDLSVAQGHNVPVEIENVVGVNDKPPTLNIIEDTEETFFENYVGGGDFSTGPDLPLIQQMLDVIRQDGGHSEINANNVEDEENLKTLNNGDSSWVIGKNVQKRKKERNVAMASLREVYENESLGILSESNITTIKLLKPTDFTSPVANSNILKSVNSPENIFNKKSKIISASEFMFKQKQKPQTDRFVKSSELLAHNNESSVVGTTNKARETTKMFVPSSRASEYYHKYLENSKAIESVNEDIWTKAQREMKEVDQERKLVKNIDISTKQEQEYSTHLIQDNGSSSCLNEIENLIKQDVSVPSSSSQVLQDMDEIAILSNKEPVIIPQQ